MPGLFLCLDYSLLLKIYNKSWYYRRLFFLADFGKIRSIECMNNKVRKDMNENFLKAKPIYFGKTACEALKMIQRPVSERKLAPYNFHFLESYIPNKTMFLNNKTLDILHKMGNLASQKFQVDLSTKIKNIYKSLLVDFSYASSKLEGNTYSYLDTKHLIEEHLIPQGYSEEETLMVINHKHAVDMILNNSDRIKYDLFSIRSVHAELSNGLLGNSKMEGAIRERGVMIGGSTYEPLANGIQIKEELEQVLRKTGEIRDPFEQSFFLLVFIPYLQAFEDVNKRTSRVFCNIPLIKNKLCPLSFLQVDKNDYVNANLAIYENNDISVLRDLYVSMYESSIMRYLAVEKKEHNVNYDFIRLKDKIDAAVTDIVKNCINVDYYVDHSPYAEGDKNLLKYYINERIEGISDVTLRRYGITEEEWEHYLNYKEEEEEIKPGM